MQRLVHECDQNADCLYCRIATTTESKRETERKKHGSASCLDYSVPSLRFSSLSSTSSSLWSFISAPLFLRFHAKLYITPQHPKLPAPFMLLFMDTTKNKNEEASGEEVCGFVAWSRRVQYVVTDLYAVVSFLYLQSFFTCIRKLKWQHHYNEWHC